MPRQNRNNIVLLYICTILSVFSILTFSQFVFPVYSKAFHLGDEWYGYLLSAATFALMLTSFPGGHLSDVIGRKWLIFAGWGLIGIGMFMLIIIQAKWFLILASLVMGVGEGISISASHALLADLVKDEHLSREYGTITALAILVAAGGPLLMGQIIKHYHSDGLGVSLSLSICAALSILAAGLSLFFREKKQHATNIPGMRDLFRLGGFTKKEKRVVRDILIVEAITGLGAGMTVPFFSIFFLNRFSSSPEHLSYIFTAATFAVAIATFCIGLIGERVKKLDAMVFGNAASIPMAIGITLSPTLLFGGVFYVLRSTLANMLMPIWGAFMMRSLGTSVRGKALGLNHMAWNLFWVLGSLVGGHVTNLLKGWAFPMVALIYTGAMVFIRADLGRRQRKRDKRDEGNEGNDEDDRNGS